MSSRPPPIINVTAPADGTHVSAGAAVAVNLTYILRAPSGQPIDRIDVLVNGRPVKEIAAATAMPPASSLPFLCLSYNTGI